MTSDSLFISLDVFRKNVYLVNELLSVLFIHGNHKTYVYNVIFMVISNFLPLT